MSELAEISQQEALELAARQGATRATRSLSGEPLQLVEFIERGLFSDPQAADFQLALMALVPVLPAARRSARFRIAHLRAVDGCSKAKEAAAMSRTAAYHYESVLAQCAGRAPRWPGTSHPQRPDCAADTCARVV